MSIFEDIEKEGLTPENEKRLTREFGSRGKKAVETGYTFGKGRNAHPPEDVER